MFPVGFKTYVMLHFEPNVLTMLFSPFNRRPMRARHGRMPFATVSKWGHVSRRREPVHVRLSTWLLRPPVRQRPGRVPIESVCAWELQGWDKRVSNWNQSVHLPRYNLVESGLKAKHTGLDLKT